MDLYNFLIHLQFKIGLYLYHENEGAKSRAVNQSFVKLYSDKINTKNSLGYNLFNA